MNDPIFKKLYDATVNDYRSYHKLVDFLGNLAEVESFRGLEQGNKNSSAAGIYHFLTNNGGGYNKRGQKVSKGAYNATGQIATSSFQTAKNRLRNMMKSDKYAENIIGSGIQPNLTKILTAKDPKDLTNQEQAILAFANLKMKGGDLQKFLDGKMKGKDLYAKNWVTLGKQHTQEGIDTNWKNALIRIKEGKKDSYSYLGIDQLEKYSVLKPEEEEPKEDINWSSSQLLKGVPEKEDKPALFDIEDKRVYRDGGSMKVESLSEAMARIKKQNSVI